MFGYNDIESKQTRFYRQSFDEGQKKDCVERAAEVSSRRLPERRFGSLPNTAR